MLKVASMDLNLLVGDFDDIYSNIVKLMIMDSLESLQVSLHRSCPLIREIFTWYISRRRPEDGSYHNAPPPQPVCQFVRPYRREYTFLWNEANYTGGGRGHWRYNLTLQSKQEQLHRIITMVQWPPKCSSIAT